MKKMYPLRQTAVTAVSQILLIQRKPAILMFRRGLRQLAAPRALLRMIMEPQLPYVPILAVQTISRPLEMPTAAQRTLICFR